MSTGETQGGEPLLDQSQTVYAFSGEALSPEQLTTVERMLGGLGLRRVEVGQTVNEISAKAEIKQEPEPESRTRQDFRDWAAENGLSDTLAGRAWSWVVKRHEAYKRGHREQQGKPDVFLLNPEASRNDQAVDLWPLYANLFRYAQAYGTPFRWRQGDKTLAFLVYLANDQLQPDEPIPIEPPLSDLRMSTDT